MVPLNVISTERNGGDDGRERKRAMGAVSSYQSTSLSTGMAPVASKPATEPSDGDRSENGTLGNGREKPGVSLFAFNYRRSVARLAPPLVRKLPHQARR